VSMRAEILKQLIDAIEANAATIRGNAGVPNQTLAYTTLQQIDEVWRTLDMLRDEAVWRALTPTDAADPINVYATARAAGFTMQRQPGECFYLFPLRLSNTTKGFPDTKEGYRLALQWLQEVGSQTSRGQDGEAGAK
jgi:hypothetical protein